MVVVVVKATASTVTTTTMTTVPIQSIMIAVLSLSPHTQKSEKWLRFKNTAFE
jgi:hypothetical protein